MSENKIIRTPITKEVTKELKAGDYVYITEHPGVGVLVETPLFSIWFYLYRQLFNIF